MIKVSFFFVGVEIPIRSEKEKFLSHGGPPEVSCFPIFEICLYTNTFTLLSVFSLLEMNLKIWERRLFWHTKCSLLVSVGG